MQDKPSPELLIAEVRKALAEGLAPGFSQKVAANALGIAERELSLSPASSAAENARLETLVGAQGDLADRNRRLAEKFRDPESAVSDAMVEHLILTTLAKIEVDQPGYAPFLAWSDAD